jgi:hypothetical protein
LACGFDAADTRETNVHQGNVRSIPFRQHHSLITIGRLPDHLEVSMLF